MPLRNLGERRVVRQDFRKDRQLAQAAGDQLGELRPEVQNDESLMVHWRPKVTGCTLL